MDFHPTAMKSPRLRFPAACLFLLALLPHVPAAASSPPNIVFIMADDLGYRELGCYGQERIRTPHLDRMAAEGMRFTQHYTSAPVCAPARCSLLTGRHGGHAYVRNNYEIGTWDSFRGQLPLPDESVTFAEILRSKGSATGAFGKWGLGEPGSSGDPLHQGFDRFFGYNCQRHAHNLFPEYLIDQDEKRLLKGNTPGLTGAHYGPQVIADEMLAFIREHRDAPFFVYYPTVIPHLALQAPEEEIAAYRGTWPETPYTGKSYLPTLLGQDQPPHDILVWDFAGYGGQLALRSGPWKLVWRDLRKRKNPRPELYHLADDPSERENLASVHPGKLRELRELLLEARKEPAVAKFRFGPYE